MSFPDQHEMHRRRNGRNLGVLAVLVLFVCLIFAVTIVKLGPDSKNPSANVSWGERLEKWLLQ